VNGRDSVSDMLYLKIDDGRGKLGKSQEIACGSVVCLGRAKGGSRTSIGKEVGPTTKGVLSTRSTETSGVF
jgi:hypothetical protein